MLTGFISRLNTMATAPFKMQMPLVPVALLFALALIVCFEWRLIVDRLEEVEEDL